MPNDFFGVLLLGLFIGRLVEDFHMRKKIRKLEERIRVMSEELKGKKIHEN